MGSDDETIIRIFVSRAEIDLRWRKDIYLGIIHVNGHSMYTGWWLKGIRRLPTERWKLPLNRLGKVVMTVVTTFLIVLDICSMLYYVQDTGGDYSKILLKLLNPESKIAWALKITSQRFPRFRLSRCLISIRFIWSHAGFSLMFAELWKYSYWTFQTEAWGGSSCI